MDGWACLLLSSNKLFFFFFFLPKLDRASILDMDWLRRVSIQANHSRINGGFLYLSTFIDLRQYCRFQGSSLGMVCITYILARIQIFSLILMLKCFLSSRTQGLSSSICCILIFSLFIFLFKLPCPPPHSLCASIRMRFFSFCA